MSRGKVYKGIGPNAGQIVPESEAFKFALKQVGVLAYECSTPEFDEFKEMLVEWYFSGNWIEAEESEAE